MWIVKVTVLLVAILFTMLAVVFGFVENMRKRTKNTATHMQIHYAIVVVGFCIVMRIAVWNRPVFCVTQIPLFRKAISILFETAERRGGNSIFDVMCEQGTVETRGDVTF